MLVCSLLRKIDATADAKRPIGTFLASTTYHLRSTSMLGFMRDVCRSHD